MLALVAALMLLAAPADAPTDPAPAAEPPTTAAVPAAPAAPTKAAANPESDMICWRETPLGTRFSQKFCAPRSVVEERKRRDQTIMRDIRANPDF